MSPCLPPGSEVIGQTTDKFGVQIQVVRTKFGDIRMVAHPQLSENQIVTLSEPSMWERQTATGAVEIKPNRAMMGAGEMRRYLKGREDL